MPIRRPEALSLREEDDMDAREIRKMKDEEITIEVGRVRTRLYELRCQTLTEKIVDHSQFGKLKKDIARLLTEQTARAGAS